MSQLYRKRPTPREREEAFLNGLSWCSDHFEFLKVDEFGKDSSRKNGLQVYCKSCMKMKSERYKDMKSTYSKNYYNKNKEVIADRQRDYIKKNSKMVVYLISNKDNGKMYVGQTRRMLSRRILQHKHPSGTRSYIKNAINKYGIDNFRVVELDTAFTQDELNAKEIFWIKTLNTIAPRGYNLELGGFNSTHSEETRKKLSKAAKGRKLTEEHKSKISKALKGKASPPRSKEVKSKDRQIKKHKMKKVLCITTGVEYESIRDAGREMGINRSYISWCCNGVAKTANGFEFRFLSNPTPYSREKAVKFFGKDKR